MAQGSKIYEKARRRTGKGMVTEESKHKTERSSTPSTSTDLARDHVMKCHNDEEDNNYVHNSKKKKKRKQSRNSSQSGHCKKHKKKKSKKRKKEKKRSSKQDHLKNRINDIDHHEKDIDSNNCKRHSKIASRQYKKKKDKRKGSHSTEIKRRRSSYRSSSDVESETDDNEAFHEDTLMSNKSKDRDHSKQNSPGHHDPLTGGTPVSISKVKKNKTQSYDAIKAAPFPPKLSKVSMRLSFLNSYDYNELNVDREACNKDKQQKGKSNANKPYLMKFNKKIGRLLPTNNLLEEESDAKYLNSGMKDCNYTTTPHSKREAARNAFTTPKVGEATSLKCSQLKANDDSNALSSRRVSESLDSTSDSNFESYPYMLKRQHSNPTVKEQVQENKLGKTPNIHNHNASESNSKDNHRPRNHLPVSWLQSHDELDSDGDILSQKNCCLDEFQFSGRRSQLEDFDMLEQLKSDIAVKARKKIKAINMLHNISIAPSNELCSLENSKKGIGDTLMKYLANSNHNQVKDSNGNSTTLFSSAKADSASETKIPVMHPANGLSGNASFQEQVNNNPSERSNATCYHKAKDDACNSTASLSNINQFNINECGYPTHSMVANGSTKLSESLTKANRYQSPLSSIINQNSFFTTALTFSTDYHDKLSLTDTLNDSGLVDSLVSKVSTATVAAAENLSRRAKHRLSHTSLGRRTSSRSSRRYLTSSSRSRSHSRAGSCSSSRSSTSNESDENCSSCSRSPSIPRRRGSPSFLDRRRITRHVLQPKYNLRHFLYIFPIS